MRSKKKNMPSYNVTHLHLSLHSVSVSNCVRFFYDPNVSVQDHFYEVISMLLHVINQNYYLSSLNHALLHKKKRSDEYMR